MNNINVEEIFGSNVFNDHVMQERLPKKVYQKLKETIKSGDTEAIKADTEALEKAFYPLAEKLYQSAQQGQAGGPNPGAGAGPQTGGDGTVYGADFEDKSDK